MIPIFKKELKNYFCSMTGYIFLGFFVLLTAVYFVMANVFSLNPNYSATLQGSTFIFLIIIPTLTMRLFSEEIRQKTDQLLFTSPVTVFQIVMGKFLAASALFVFGMLITALFPIWISAYGTVPAAQIFTSFVGYTLLGFCFISVGLFVSVTTDNQIISAVATFAALFLFFIMNSIASVMPVSRVSSIVFIAVIIFILAYVVYTSTKKLIAGLVVLVFFAVIVASAYFINNLWFDGVIPKVLNWLSIFSSFDGFSVGILDLADVVYYVTFSAAFIYLSINVIEKRRWN